MSKAGIEYMQNKLCWSQRGYRYKEDIVIWNINTEGSCLERSGSCDFRRQIIRRERDPLDEGLQYLGYFRGRFPHILLFSLSLVP
jgi:hypothetical protein